MGMIITNYIGLEQIIGAKLFFLNPLILLLILSDEFNLIH